MSVDPNFKIPKKLLLSPGNFCCWWLVVFLYLFSLRIYAAGIHDHYMSQSSSTMWQPRSMLRKPGRMLTIQTQSSGEKSIKIKTWVLTLIKYQVFQEFKIKMERDLFLMLLSAAACGHKMYCSSLLHKPLRCRPADHPVCISIFFLQQVLWKLIHHIIF